MGEVRHARVRAVILVWCGCFFTIGHSVFHVMVRARRLSVSFSLLLLVSARVLTMLTRMNRRLLRVDGSSSSGDVILQTRWSDEDH